MMVTRLIIDGNSVYEIEVDYEYGMEKEIPEKGQRFKPEHETRKESGKK